MKKVMVLACALGALLPAASAAVQSSGPSGFALGFEGDVAIPPAEAYAKFLQVGGWWNPEHSYSGDAANLRITPEPGGCWCETVPGGFVEHLRVVNAAPGRMLVFSGGLGPLQYMGVAGSMVVTFEAKDAGTHVKLRYAVGGISLLAAGCGFWWAWIDRERLTWHDRISRTRMIRETKQPAK